jgi:transketolase
VPKPVAPLDLLCVNTIRALAMDGVQKANSGHPGMPMGAAPMAFVLWQRHLRHSPANPNWVNRDRFILSPGHGCMLLYSLLHLTGYDLPLEELKRFRQLDSRCPGHSEHPHTAGVETTTGPLGQGFSAGVGMAMAQKHLAARFNRSGHDLLDYFIYALVSDGDLMEGLTHEAAGLAGHLKLDNLIYLYDDNRISIEGRTSLTFTEDRRKRFEAYGWHTQVVPDGNDLAAIHRCLLRAKKVKDQPHLILVRTVIGYGSPNKRDTSEVHGAPLGLEELKLAKQTLGEEMKAAGVDLAAAGWNPEAEFHIPAEAGKAFRKAVARGKRAEAEWNAGFAAYAQAFPREAQEFKDWQERKLPAGWSDALPTFAGEKPMATRQAGSKVLAALAPKLPMLLGGSADLHPSTNTYVKGTGDFQHPSNQGDTGTYAGRNFHFGVREHAMMAAVNGLALSKMLIPYGSTFLVFSDYCKMSLRLAAMMKLQSIFVFTHDSIGIGEDGPTHQPIEHLAALRAIYGLVTIRPSDASEVSIAWKVAVERRDGPTCLILTRQAMNVLDRTKYPAASNLEQGAYLLVGGVSEKPDVILIATGSEVQPTLEAVPLLQQSGLKARVVAMPSMELFESQPKEYRDAVLPPEVKARVAVEAGHPMCWHKYVGPEGALVCMNSYGGSAPYKALFEKFGFTAANIAAVAKKAAGR